MKKTALILVGLALTFLGFGQNYPFPMNEKSYEYPYGILPTNISNSTIQSKFEAWESALYTESGDYGRIKYDDVNYTVSEGIAYGMLIYVYMANKDNNEKCQDHFDKLYRYYKNWSNWSGLMHWKIQGFSSIANGGSGAATDADLDVGLALCLAAKQWESSDSYVYADEAESILKNVYNNEVGTHNGLKVFKPGDSWDNQSNPCYFTVASVGVFQQAQDELGFSTTKDWETVYEDSHTYLEKSQRLGVWPNWADWSTNYAPTQRSWGDAKDKDFGWDACRCPWRIAWDYLWFGNESSKKMMDKTVEMCETNGWANSASVGFLTGLNGSSYSSLSIPSSESYSAGNVAWTGSVACAFMVDADYQSYLDVYNKSLNNKTGGPYYAQTLQILYMLTLSGNAANFYDCNGSGTVPNPVVTAAATDGKSISLNCSKKMASSSDYSKFTIFKNGTEQSSVISSMTVSGNTISLNLKNITIEPTDIISISYNGTTLLSEKGGVLSPMIKMSVKNNVSGGDTILADCETTTCIIGGSWYIYNDNESQAASTISPTKAEDMLVSGGKEGKAVKISYSLDQNNYAYEPFVGFGFNLYDGTEEETYDCTGATAISFYHKGSAVTFQVKVPGTGDNFHSYNVESHSNWTLVTVNWNYLEQEPYWGTTVDFSEAKIFGLQWQVKGSTGDNGTIWIDEVTLIGKSIVNESVDRKALEANIATANALYGSATTVKYPQSAITAFFNAIDAAATVNMNASATQSQIDDANSALADAIATFKASEIIPVNKTALSTTIASANMLIQKSTIGTQRGEYPLSAKNALDNAITSAQSVYDNANATQTEVDAATTAINTAIEDFKASVIIDKSELQRLIDLADNIIAETENMIGTEVGQYSEYKLRTLKTKLKTAKSNNSNTSVSQNAVDRAAESLQTAYDEFVASKVEDNTADEDINFVFSIYPNPCSTTLNIEASDEIAYVRIIGINGTKVLYNIGQENAQIYVGNLKNGNYFAQIVFKNGTIKTEKFIKE